MNRKHSMRAFLICAAIFFYALPTVNADSLRVGTIEYADLTGYSHASVTAAGGQTFLNAFPGVDITVEASGSFKLPTTYNTIGLARIRTSVDSGSNQLDFSITGSLAGSTLFVDILTTDRHEIVNVTSNVATLNYQHLSGMAPNMSGDGTTDLTMQGTGVMIHPVTGAADGRILFSQPDNFTVDYTGLTNNKFEYYRIGRMVIPEPCSGMMAFSGLIALLSCRRTTSGMLAG
jgi:hypothetical protein